ncbi:MAG: serine/threonine-protein phosphatase [Deltaproteobacteria bacterium]|nr:serine/threonine-protein phosphatase [Deltaproteobacteria bacterium]
MNAAPQRERTRAVAGGATHPGKRRKLNEDFLLLRPRLGLYLVADGVGGRNAGEVASALTAHSMCNFFESTEDGEWPDEYKALFDLTLPPAAQRLSAAIRKANDDVYRTARTRTAHQRMNSTVVAAHHPPGAAQIHIAHVGDSRCYRLRDDELKALTRDHSLRSEALLNNPTLTKEALAGLSAHAITRALGSKETIEIAMRTAEVLPGDVYLLCSDGINRMLEDELILEVLQLTDDPRGAAQLLVDFANDAGGRDNCTALVIRIEEH